MRSKWETLLTIVAGVFALLLFELSPRITGVGIVSADLLASHGGQAMMPKVLLITFTFCVRLVSLLVVSACVARVCTQLGVRLMTLLRRSSG